jgi:tetratricopeptide (TPR) repeat protein
MAGEPISARPVGLAERTWKFVRRRPAVAALAAVSLFAAVGLLGGGVYHAITLQRALDAEVQAKNEAAASAQKARERFDLALDAYSQLVTQVRRMNAYPALRNEQKKALSLVTRGLQRIGDVYATFEPNLQRASAESLLGRFYLDLGQPGQAVRHTAEAVRIATRIAQENPDDYRTRSVEASALNNHISVFLNTNEIDKAAPFAVQIEEAAEAVLRTAGPDDNPYSVYARCAAQAAQVYLWRREVAAAGPLIERLVERARVRLALEPDDIDRLYVLSLALDRASALHTIRGDEAAALAATEEALPISRKLAAAEPDNPQIQRSVLVHLGNLGEVALEKRQLEKAHSFTTEAFEIARKLAASDPENVNFQDDLVMTQAQLAATHLARLDPAGARAGFLAAEAILEARDARGNKTGNACIEKELRPKILSGIRYSQQIIASIDQPEALAGLPPKMRADALAQRVAVFLRQNRRDQAARALAEFAAEALPDDSIRWLAVERWCLLMGIAENDPPLREDCVRNAWRTLDAIETLPKPADLEANPVLTPLKGDPKWQNLLARTR